MTQYQVQYELPSEEPEKKVRIRRSKGRLVFFVPINYPDAHKLSLFDLIAAAELSGLVDLPTTLNRKKKGV